MILTPLLKLPKNVGDLGKFIVAKGFKSCPKCKKSPNLVTLVQMRLKNMVYKNANQGTIVVKYQSSSFFVG